jgi:hypothetical protein
MSSTVPVEKSCAGPVLPARKRLFLGIVAPIALMLAALAPSLILYSGQEFVSASDFRNLYTSGVLLTRHELYNLDKEGALQSECAGGVLERPVPFSHPPFVALLMAAFSPLPFRTAYYVMLGVNTIILGLCLWLISGRFRLEEGPLRSFNFVVLASVPLYVTFLQGQLSFVALLLTILFIADLEKEKAPGLWAGLMWFKPSLALIPSLLLLFRRKWQAFAALCAVGVVYLGLSFLLVGPDGMSRWFSVLQFVSSSPELQAMRQGMTNLRALSMFLTGGQWLGYVLSAGVLAALWFRRENPVVLILAVILATPHLYTHDCSVGVVAAAIATKHAPRKYPLFAALVSLPLVATMLLKSVPGTVVPLAPIVLAGIFCLCAWKNWGISGSICIH